MSYKQLNLPCLKLKENLISTVLLCRVCNTNKTYIFFNAGTFTFMRLFRRLGAKGSYLTLVRVADRRRRFGIPSIAQTQILFTLVIYLFLVHFMTHTCICDGIIYLVHYYSVGLYQVLKPIR